MIKIQEGNDFDLCFNARTISGNEDVPVSFAAIDVFACNLIKWTGTRIPMERLYVNEDGDLVIQVREHLNCTVYAIELTGKYDGYNWRHCIGGAFRIVPCSCQSNVIDSETMTVDTYNFEVYIGGSTVTYKDMERYLDEHQFISDVEVEIDGETGTPSGTGTFTKGKLALDLHNLKGERGFQGTQGTSAIWSGDAEVLTELEHTTGQATNRTMSQKSITDNIGITMTQAEYDAITPESNVKYIITEDI